MRSPARVALLLVLAGAGAWAVWTRWSGGAPEAPPGPGGARTVEPPGGDESGPGGWERPPPPPGTEVELELLGAPARAYAARREDDEADATYREVVASLERDDVVYDRHLSRAAREVAFQSAVLGESPPQAVMAFLLQSAGVPARSASLFRLSTTSESPRVLRQAVAGALEDPPRGRGRIFVGVGEAATPGDRYSRRVTVLLTRRSYELEPAPRRAPLGGTWTLRVTPPPGFRAPVASALYPDGEIRRLHPERDREALELAVPAGDSAGTLQVSIDGVFPPDEDGPGGPGKLLQLSVEVGRDPPRRFRYIVPERDQSFAGPDEAETYALALLNADRARFGVPPLIPDPELAAVARAHSEDMRDRGFFGHRSPETGLVADRLAAAGYRAVTHGENLARNDSLFEAEQSLLASVSHRRSLLDPAFTHVGIGVAARADGERTDWYLTQVFARKAVELEPEEGESRVLESLQGDRVGEGAPTLALDQDLSEVARKGAAAAAEGDVEGLAERIGEEARRFLRGPATVTVQRVYELDGYGPPAPMLSPELAVVGVGVVQSEGDLRGRLGVVLIGAER